MSSTQPQTFKLNNDLEGVVFVINQSLSLQKIEDMLDQTDMSADSKSMILNVARYTIVIGDKVVAFGRKIVSLAIELAKTFPNTLLGVALALVITSLIGGIPILGALLAGFLKSILLIFGLTQGVLADMRGGELGKRVENLVAQFSPLNGLVK